LGTDLGMVSLDGERTITTLLETDFTERYAALSPDGRWMAYESNESGIYEVLVRPFPDANAARLQVSSGGGRWPLWAPDGRELFYVGPHTMMSVAVETEPTLTFGRHVPLFDTSGFVAPPGAVIRRAAIAADGRFLLLKRDSQSAEADERPSIVVVENWFEELKRLVPTN